MMTFTIDLTTVHSSLGLHEHLKEVFSLPDYYVYGDRIIEKTGINRERRGKCWKTPAFQWEQTYFRRERPAHSHFH